MKRILSKYWLVLFIAVLIAWPAAVISMQRVDPPDEATLNKLESLLEEKLQMSNKTIAPPPPEWDMEKRKVFMRDTSFNELLPIVAGDTLSEKLKVAEEVYEPFIQYHDSLSSGTISQDYTHLLERQIAVKIQRASAQRAILTKDWDEALRRLYSAANMGNSCREQSLIGMQIATATRGMAYGGYEKLLHADAPIEVKRAALDQLIRLRDTEPYFNENIVFGETLSSLKNRRKILKGPEKAKQILGTNNVQYEYPIQMLVMGRVANMQVLGDDENYKRLWSNPAPKGITDQRLKRWIVNRARESFREGYPHGLFKWTDVPAAERWLKEMVEKEPWIYKIYGFSEETYKGLDPWTMSLYGYLNYLGANLDESATRCKITSTKGRLLEAAFAAQIHQRETGTMPDSATINETLSPLPETTYGPIQILQPNSYDELKISLWSNVLPSLKGTWLNPKEDLATYQWSAYFTGQIGEARQKAAEALALKQILGQYPRLVEDVHVNIQLPNSWPKKFNSMKEAEDVLSASISTAPVSPTPTPTPTPTPRYGGYGGYGGYGYGSPQPPAPAVFLHFSATLRAPDSVWILWSPGPDGEDDGGTIQYDPTNGTMSRGDLIVFPEVF